MTSILNTATASGVKGAFGVGTGDASDYSVNFLKSVIVPKNPAGAVLPGYTLQSSTTSDTGLDWNFTGANGKTIATYQYPGNCPVPFPSPEDIPSDLVLITREDAVTAESGIVDLYMPVLGTQGVVPRHTLPPLADVDDQLVFYFDDANAAINVYCKTTREWKMGWLRANPSFSFRWRAAGVLNGSKLNGATPYSAPYNAKGLFFSAVSTSFTNSTFGQKTFNLGDPQPGFYFIPFTTTSGNIDPWVVANFYVPTQALYSSDMNVSSVVVLDQNDVAFNNPVAVGVSELVVAISVAAPSQITTSLFSWWGFLGRDSTNLANTVRRNPNLSAITVATDVLPYSINNAGVSTGSILTLSLDESTNTFFLGGNYSSLKFNNVVVDFLLASGYTQIGAVALQYRYTGISSTMTILNYEVIGANAATLANSRDWTGIITQSNFSDGCFAYGGNFVTPPSSVLLLSNAGKNIATDPFVSLPPQQLGLLPTPYAQVLIPDTAKGGKLTTLDILFPDTGVDSVPFSATGSITGQRNFAVALIPNDGDLRQSSFPPTIVGGNFLQPSAYQTTSVLYAQTQAPIVAADWWFSTIEFFCQTATTTPVTIKAYLYPDDIFNHLVAPLQFSTTKLLVAGRNYINVLGAGTILTTPVNNSGGVLLNSNVTITGTLTTYNIPRTWFLRIDFSNQADTAPVNVPIGINTGNQSLNPMCWTLRGYSTSGINVASAGPGLFSSRALTLPPTAVGACAQNALAGRRVLTYSNLNILVPLNAINYNVYVIPLNWDNDPSINGFNFAFSTPQSNTSLITRLYFSEDRQGDFAYSCLHLVRNPSVVYEVPTMASSDSVTPAVSLYMNSRREIYKSASANADRLALGVYTNFQEVSDLQFVLQNPGTSVSGAVNEAYAAFNGAGTFLFLNTYSGIEAPPNYAGFVLVGDTIVISRVVTPFDTTIYRVTGNVTQTGSPTFVATIPVTLVSAGTPIATPNAVLIDILLSRNPRQTPFVLKENFGPYLIGNGTEPTTVRDVYLASFEATGKAYRYVPDYQSSFLSFTTNLFVGAPTVDDTILADTALFNSNSSSILLSKAADSLGGSQYWNVANVSGNVGFNNQRA